MFQSALVRLGLLSIISILLAECAGGTPASPSPSGPLPSAAASAIASAEPSAVGSALPSAVPGATPDRKQAYERLLAAIPPDIAAYCEPFPEAVDLEPGQLGQADCDPPTGAFGDVFVSYELWQDQASMDEYFDTQRLGHENLGSASGPGCGKGPGEGTWEHGRKDCFTFFDAYVMWTYDGLDIRATALQDDEDFAKLEEFWKTAGPVAP